MTAKFISTYVTGYDLSPTYDTLVITRTGSVGYDGVYASGAATLVFNYGDIHAGPNVEALRLSHGGTVFNGKGAYVDPVIEGGLGVVGASAALTVANYGTIIGTNGAAISAGQGGKVVNGSLTDPAALIEGGAGGIGGGGVHAGGTARETVVNFGTIMAIPGGYGWLQGIGLYAGGVVTNGAVSETTALIEGRTGVEIFQAARVNNFATIKGLESYGVRLHDGGVVTNGKSTSTSARIDGRTGVSGAGVITVANFGAIVGAGALHGDYGVRLLGGGVVDNGAANDPQASITGFTGVSAQGRAATVTNDGTIQGAGNETLEYGVDLKSGGAVYNGAAADRSATIGGYGGVKISGASGRIENYGTVRATGVYAGYVANAGDYGVELAGGGAVVNGGSNDTSALIEGGGGIELLGAATARNYGTIWGDGNHSGVGAILAGDGESLTNAGSGVIEGPTGVVLAAAYDTLVNAGLIAATGGVALELGSPSDVLVVQPGARFEGVVLGDGGALILDGGAGSLVGVLGRNVTVTSDTGSTVFTDFASLDIGAKAAFTISQGGVRIFPAKSLIVEGSLTIARGQAGGVVNRGLIEASGGRLVFQGNVANDGTLDVSGGSLTVDGAVTGAGSAILASGTLAIAGAFGQDVAFTGEGGTLALGQSRTYAGVVSGFPAGGGGAFDLRDIGFVGAGEATFSGTASGGILTVTDGTHAAHINLSGNYLGSTFVASGDGHGGVLVTDPSAARIPVHAMVAAMASLGAWAMGAAYAVSQARPETPMALALPVGRYAQD